MKILSHRGMWESKEQQNTLSAFKLSFMEGIGIETDLRDYLGEIVISHDIPTKQSITLEDLLISYKSMDDNSIFLALNIKSDGLHRLVNNLLKKYQIDNYFVFDMSIPDSFGYMKQDLKFFMRQSEFEKEVILYDNSNGVWLDCFESEWYSNDLIQNHLDNNKKVAIVSPELHKRNHINFWENLKKCNFINNENILLCTDFPSKANSFFNSL
jgi:glycerophosphoryl diester phosphodiesterase